MVRRQRDRNLSDLTPTLAEYILHHAREHIAALASDQHEITGPNGDRFQAQQIIRNAVQIIRGKESNNG